MSTPATAAKPAGDGPPYAAWFGAAMWAGILVDWVLGVPGIFLPNATLALARQPLALETPVWPAFASLLLVLLAAFYVPGAIDPYRYKATAVLSVLARPPGVVFFLWLWPDRYPLFGWIDLGLTLVQAPLLFLALRHEP
jgi:hypothetical protein